MNLDKGRVIREQGVKLGIGGIGAGDVCTGQATKGIRDNLFLTWFMLNIQLELLEELRGPDKTEVHPHGRRCRGDGRLLKNIQNG